MVIDLGEFEMKKYLVITMLSIVLAACNQSASQKEGGIVTPSTLNGAYTSGKDTFIFSSDGKVTAKNNLFPDKTTTYTIEGGKVSMKFPDGYPMTFSLNSDGSITSNSNINYKKTD
ncbi:hypothetical protein AU476_00965 [Cupriavidus sp. UYMSc13B]|nr:hypothetical protein AU476_00965 [Cupriavidus sp. UYMSc13B]